MFIFGSRALRAHITIDREPADLDIIGTYEEIVDFRRDFDAKVFYPIASGTKMFMKSKLGTICEADIAWPDSAEERLLQFLEDQTDNKGILIWEKTNLMVPSLDVLYMLKMSHRYKKNSPHFLKTMKDIRMMREAGAVIRPEHEEFYKQRMKDTYSYHHPKLDVSKKDFFKGDGVEYTYDHDSIHEAVAISILPAYRYYMQNEAEVMTDKQKFFELPYIYRIRGVIEESMVLAIERSLVPYPGAMTPDAAFKYALMKVCTSITSGWFREFAWEHHDNCINAYNTLKNDSYGCYWNKFQSQVRQGKVKLHQEVTS